jgi:hypothetical protein
VKPYGASGIPGPFAEAVSCFTALISRLTDAAAQAMPHHELGQLLEADGREVLRLLLQGCLEVRAEREEKDLAGRDAAERAALGMGRTRLEKGRQRQLATTVGTVTVRRCALRAPGRASHHPADAQLALPAGRHSLGLRRLAALEAARGSYDEAVAAVRRCCGHQLAKRQLEMLVKQAAVDVAAFCTARAPAPATATTLLVITVDGKGIAMRPDHSQYAEGTGSEAWSFSMASFSPHDVAARSTSPLSRRRAAHLLPLTLISYAWPHASRSRARAAPAMRDSAADRFSSRSSSEIWLLGAAVNGHLPAARRHLRPKPATPACRASC